MIDRTHALKVSRQCELLDLQRSTFYYKPKADHSKSLDLMRKIDALHLEFPWMGSRSIKDQLARGGISVCRDRVRGLMRKMGIHAIYRAPRSHIGYLCAFAEQLGLGLLPGLNPAQSNRRT